MEPRVTSSIMTFDQASSNLLEIYYNPNAIYAVKKDGKIESISKWNVFSRLYNYAKGFSDKETVKKTISISLSTVNSNIDIKTSFFRERPIWRYDMYKPNRPFQDVTQGISNISLIKKDADLTRATSELSDKCQGFYERVKAVKDLFHTVYELPNEVSDMDDTRIRNNTFKKYIDQLK